MYGSISACCCRAHDMFETLCMHIIIRSVPCLQSDQGWWFLRHICILLLPKPLEQSTDGQRSACVSVDSGSFSIAASSDHMMTIVTYHRHACSCDRQTHGVGIFFLMQRKMPQNARFSKRIQRVVPPPNLGRRAHHVRACRHHGALDLERKIGDG
jgi:hypothetical protein